MITLGQSCSGHNAAITLPSSDTIYYRRFSNYDLSLASATPSSFGCPAVASKWFQPLWYSLTGYESFHKNRAHKKGGGVICYIKKALTAVKIEKQDADKCDSVYVDINTERIRKFTIGTVYRPPKLQAADDTALYEEINSVTQNKEVVIFGEFNCPSVDWNLMHGDQEGNRLVDMVED